MMSPLEIDVLIHYYRYSAPHPMIDETTAGWAYSLEGVVLFTVGVAVIVLVIWFVLSENFVLFLKIIWPAIKDAWLRFWRWFK